MRTYFDCYPCFVRQAIGAARYMGADEDRQFAILRGVLGLLQDLERDTNPAEIGYRVHRYVREQGDSDDPYREAKADSTRQALNLYPQLKDLVAGSDDPLDMAVRLSIAGNIIDFAVSDRPANLEHAIASAIKLPFVIDDLPTLRERLQAAGEVLFLADNAGETVFDRVLIEAIDVPATYAVKGGPILNDATLDDAREAGLDTCASLVSNGSEAPGTILELCSPEFRRLFEQAPLVIAKGQGNYETLSDAGEKVFCLLQVKCPIIGADIGAPVGSLIVRQCSK